jgi:hypothetical protein
MACTNCTNSTNVLPSKISSQEQWATKHDVFRLYLHSFHSNLTKGKRIYHHKSPNLSSLNVKGQLSLCITNEALYHEGVWGSGCIDPCFLDLSTNWRWVVRFTPQPLYPRGKNPWYPLARRLGGPQSWSGWRGEEKILDRTKTQAMNPHSSSP